MTGIAPYQETIHLSQQYVRLYIARAIFPGLQDLRFAQIPLELLCSVPSTEADSVWGSRLNASTLTRSDCVI